MRKRVFLWAQAALCVLLGVLLAAAFLGMYREGAALRASGQLSAPLFTREGLAARLRPLWSLCLLILVGTGIGCVLGWNAADSRPRQVLFRPDAPKGTEKDGVARALLLALAAALIVHGIFNGSMRDVFVKAVQICSECIGLG